MFVEQDVDKQKLSETKDKTEKDDELFDTPDDTDNEEENILNKQVEKEIN